MTAPAEYAVGAEGLSALRAAIGVQTWPAVLDEPPTGDEARPAGDEPADRDGPTDEIPWWLAESLRVLANPSCHIEIRTVDDSRGDIERTCVAAGPGRVVAATATRRCGDGMTTMFRDLGTPADLVRDGPAVLAAAVRRYFGDAATPAFGSVTAPRDHVVDILRHAAGLEDTALREAVADGLRRLCADDHRARSAAAFATAGRRSEIVAYAAAGAVRTRSSGAVGIFECAGGRIIASAADAADGRLWTTLSPGTGHRIEQSVTLLLEPLHGLIAAGAH
ncbi:ESX secretion-associated protein EspG [Gordonia pseudamarae]|uniref:ESX secretion-associated protein EspG n=1 Tax=Gordonia pseudamarae TaxID=2831662 RepID=A0ABX6IKS0_9ACTN|nr:MULTISPECIES: ESX secretion-associated protein EspG [Gordonia]MBD0022773.1 ESX secretion-associated protein EspG [Gordonia sp. (in: high G+C Gram-positive bacteria)]QHN27372.1 ESX secretion-associated protein EspG [Gordonia pseudamarae]QHN36256.1 ESX secretion-associated protein EspG [Gordonia pseudamarae]